MDSQENNLLQTVNSDEDIIVEFKDLDGNFIREEHDGFAFAHNSTIEITVWTTR